MSPYLILLYAVLAIVIAIIYRRIMLTVTIFEYQRGLKYVRGRYVGLLPPGRYAFWRHTTHVTYADIRPVTECVPGQEVLTSDGLPVKTSLAVDYRVADADLAINKTASYHSSLYVALQVALREAVGAVTLDDLLAQRAEIAEKLTEAARPLVEALGLELISLKLRDITLPGELKKVFLQVVKARQEGLAALERARGETAALRSLANAARMMEKSPGMLPLRIIHSMGLSTGNTYVMGLPSGTLPLVKDQTDANVEPFEPNEDPIP